MTAAAEPSTLRLRSLAGNLQAAATKITPTTLAVSALRPNPDQPRRIFEEEKIANLAASIAAQGVIEPLVVRPTAVPGTYEIVCGECRWRASQRAGLTTVPVVVREISDDDAFAQSLVENLDREGMHPADEIRAVASLAEKCGGSEAARLLGKTPDWISKRRKIASATALADFVASGACTDVETLVHLARLAEEDAGAAEAVIAAHKPGGRLREAIRDARSATSEPEPAPSPSSPASPDRKRRPTKTASVLRIDSVSFRDGLFVLRAASESYQLKLSKTARAQLAKLL